MILKEQNKTDGNHRTSDLEFNVFWLQLELVLIINLIWAIIHQEWVHYKV